jgi:hypothetical protein
MINVYRKYCEIGGMDSAVDPYNVNFYDTENRIREELMSDLSEGPFEDEEEIDEDEEDGGTWHGGGSPEYEGHDYR